RSAGDALWLRGFCRAWDVPLLTARAARPPRSEADARAQRYEYLKNAAHAAGADAILTAHHADDQAETVLFRILRGTGVTGLAGIAAARQNIVRPLLPFLRRELLAYARAHRLQWREDETNLDMRYARNRIRRDVLPALERVAPGSTRRIAQLAADAAREEAAWHHVIESVVRDVVVAPQDTGFTLARERLLAYHPHIRARVMRHLLHGLGGRADRALTRLVLQFITTGSSGSGISLPAGIRLERELDCLRLHRAAAQAMAPDRPLVIDAPGAGSGELVTAGRRCAVYWAARTAAAPANAGVAPPLPATVREGDRGETGRFDPSSLRFPLTLRAWRAGDRIRLAYGSKKLKKLFLERRLARARRARTPVLTDEAGRVVWVVGQAQADGTAWGGGDLFEIRVVDVDAG
ncbi:MAG TPA: tRNA lysidine(34) synthetase TilS, partial [Longimicrobiales bacterium]|nr:tRNA lysidine(34) synthetase TilS [Longimicrobiales bacterium]